MKTTLVLLGALCLTACSTPKPALDQANFTASLVTDLGRELKEFDRVQAAAVAARERAMVERLTVVEETDSQARIELAAREANGDTAPQKLVEKLKGITTLVGQEDVKLKTTTARINTEMAGLVKPLPVTDEKITAAQKALVDMGSELPASTRFKEVQSFYKVVKTGVDDNKKKLKEAEDAAKKAEKAKKKE